MSRRALVFVVLLGCSIGTPGPGPEDTGLDGLVLRTVNPSTLVPGSVLVAQGDSFVGAQYGATVLRLRGTFSGTAIDTIVPLQFSDYQTLITDWAGGRAAGLPGDDGIFDGLAVIEVESTIDHRVHSAAPVHVTLTVAAALVPRLDNLTAGPIYVNQPIELVGGGLLLGGAEGETLASVTGCYRPARGEVCSPVAPVDIPVVTKDPYDRTHATFAFDPRIAGIQPGTFEGLIRLKNVTRQATAESPAKAATFTLLLPIVLGIAPNSASLGQYVEINGGGFVGTVTAQTTSYTLLELVGEFTYDDETAPRNATISLVPDFVSGVRARYTLNEDDPLGMAVDLRTRSGRFSGTVRPIIHYGSVTVPGEATAIALGVDPVKQVVWVQFMPAYTESLRKYGLRAADRFIRDRVLAIGRRDYAGVNVEFRTEEPTDFALYTTIQIGGPDPSEQGNFGYDNTPGKDVGNERLFDQIGGYDAMTLKYGGVFVESFFQFSQHPGAIARFNPDAAVLEFDQIFDSFREDLGGVPVLAADLAGFVPLTSGAACPADSADRKKQIACAVWVLGSMIGSTMTHEFGHSLGLAAGGAESHVHNSGEQPNRLMDAGAGRPWLERAEIKGRGPALFCADDYDYLRQILRTTAAPPMLTRPPCD